MHAWLSNQIGAFTESITVGFMLFVVIIVISAMVIMFLRHFNKRDFNTHKKNPIQRLTICDAIKIDCARRLILVRCDDTEHLILIGGSTDCVVKSNVVGSPQSIYQQKKNTQPASTILETHQDHDLTEKSSFSTCKMEHAQENIPISFVDNGHLKDSAIIAEIEGRQEPSLFVPSPKK
ncbi:flagellar biosynthetic protein FliO [Bartonella sp. B10]